RAALQHDAPGFDAAGAGGQLEAGRSGVLLCAARGAPRGGLGRRGSAARAGRRRGRGGPGPVGIPGGSSGLSWRPRGRDEQRRVRRHAATDPGPIGAACRAARGGQRRMILYLHGFRSSPRSTKAERLRSALAARGRGGDFVCPQLPVSPRAAVNMALAAAELENPARLALVGSSLGGYYATWVAERLGCRAVLLNPAVSPAVDLATQLGRHPVFSLDQTVELTADHLGQLRAVDTARIT